MQYWKEYAAKLDAPVTKNAFNAITPQLEGRSILIELTALQDKAMNSECPKFLGFLKQQKNIENYSLERKIVQSKQVLSENTFRPTAYRPEEQLKEMIQTNPKLADLVARLKLEVE